PEKPAPNPGYVTPEFAATPTPGMKALPRVVADTPIGKKVTVKVLREGKPVELTAEVGRLEDGEKLVASANPEHTPPADTADTLGMKLSIITDAQRQRFNIDEGLAGAIVTEVDPNGPAAEKRI